MVIDGYSGGDVLIMCVVDIGYVVPNIKLSSDDVDDSLGKLILAGVGVGVFSLNMAASCP